LSSLARKKLLDHDFSHYADREAIPGDAEMRPDAHRKIHHSRDGFEHPTAFRYT
jgi:hypothetical protein